MCGVFFPASENVHQNLTPSIQSRMLNTRLKAQCHSHINTQPLLEEGGEVETSKVWSTCVCQCYLASALCISSLLNVCKLFRLWHYVRSISQDQFYLFNLRVETFKESWWGNENGWRLKESLEHLQTTQSIRTLEIILSQRKEGRRMIWVYKTNV